VDIRDITRRVQEKEREGGGMIQLFSPHWNRWLALPVSSGLLDGSYLIAYYLVTNLPLPVEALVVVKKTGLRSIAYSW
jgi:hypothetical protein